jgi:hypothetical protein
LNYRETFHKKRFKISSRTFLYAAKLQGFIEHVSRCFVLFNIIKYVYPNINYCCFKILKKTVTYGPRRILYLHKGTVIVTT